FIFEVTSGPTETAEVVEGEVVEE
ncbi:hypothetical protein LCGC14_1810410, partial [marine sediment metagenome]